MKAKTQPWYKTTSSIRGPLIVVEKVKDVAYGEICKIKSNDRELFGQVLDASKDKVVVQLFENSMGLDLNAKVQFTGKTAELGVSKDMIGRVFDGLGNSKDGASFVADKYLDVNGSAINPASRKKPSQFIQTGISTIDCMTTLVRGQK